MFQFTIRDVLWLIALAATALGWWADHQQQISHYRMLSQTILSVGGIGLNFDGNGTVTYYNKAEPNRLLGVLRP